MSAVTQEALLAELPGLARFAYFLCGDPQLADDLVQDCMVRAIASANRKEENKSLRAWLFAILRNRHIDLKRQFNKKPDTESLEEKAWALPSPDQHGQSAFLHDLSRAYANLPVELREIMWLVGIQGLTYSEAAQVIEIPVGTVRSRMFRARELLRDGLKDYCSSSDVEATKHA